MKRFRVLRYIAYTIEIIVFFIIQQTPGLIPSVYGILPTLLIPIACSIAMFEGPVCSLFYGVFSGFLLDYGTNCTFGFHALILGLICFIISFLVQDVFHNNFLTGLIMMYKNSHSYCHTASMAVFIHLKGLRCSWLCTLPSLLTSCCLYFSVGSFVLLFQSWIFLHLTRRTFSIVTRKNIPFTDFFSFVHPSVI